MKEHRDDVYRFGDFVYDDSVPSLCLGAFRVEISPKSLAILRFLLQHPGVVVKKTELMAAVWPDVTVVANNVDRQVSTLRSVLGQTPEGGDYIETAHR